MCRALLMLLAGIIFGAGGMYASHYHDDSERVKVLSNTDIKEKLDGKDATTTVVQLTIEPGQAGAPHRHPGPVFGYVLEGEYELGIDNQPTKTLKTGDTFYEPTGCLHRVSNNPGKVKTRVIAVVMHPRDAKQLAIPEAKKD